MDFIEKLFAISPDAGTGLTESIWLLAIIGIFAGVAWILGMKCVHRQGLGRRP